jgi:hypothetical protein
MPDTEEVTGSNPVRPTPFFENLSSAGSPKGSQPPAGLLLNRWSEHPHVTVRIESIASSACPVDLRAAVAVIPMRYLSQTVKMCSSLIAPPCRLGARRDQLCVVHRHAQISHFGVLTAVSVLPRKPAVVPEAVLYAPERRVAFPRRRDGRPSDGG